MNRYHTHTLGNGLRIVWLEHDCEVAYCGYALRAGTRDERTEAGEGGLAHFCEHMTFKGTQRRSSLQVINTLERIGGELNAFTAKEETVYYAAVLKQYFNRAVDLLTDIVFYSIYPDQAADKEKEVVCDEIESYNDSPAELIYDKFEDCIFKGTSLGHSILGEQNNVRSFTGDNCRIFTERMYIPENAVFYVVGDIDFFKLVKKLEVLTKPIQRNITYTKPLQSCITKEEMHSEVLTLNHSTHQGHLMLGTTITKDIGRWRTPLFLTNNIIGGPSMNSRLNVSLRERRGLVYTVESMVTTYTDALVWSVYLGCDKHDIEKCSRLVLNEMHRLQRSPLSASMLASAKKQIKGQMALAAQNKENFAIDMAKYYLHYGELRDNTTLFEEIDRVTADDIHTLMNTWLADERMTKVIIQ